MFTIFREASAFNVFVRFYFNGYYAVPVLNQEINFSPVSRAPVTRQTLKLPAQFAEDKIFGKCSFKLAYKPVAICINQGIEQRQPAEQTNIMQINYILKLFF